MTKQDEIKLLNDMMVELTQHSCALSNTYSAGRLEAIDDRVYFIAYDGKRKLLTYVPYEDDGYNKIDMRVRKRLAIDFVKIYGLSFLHAEREKAIETENKKNEKLKSDYDHLNSIIDKFNMFDKVELKQYATYPCITLESNWKDYDYKYCTKNKSYELCVIDNGYRVQEAYNRLEGVDFKTIVDVLSYCDKLAKYINVLKSEAKTRIKEQDSKEDREVNIRTLCYNMARDKNNAYIVKSKKTYTVYRGMTKYSMRGVGKYYTADYDKLATDMINGKVTHYIKVDADFKRSDIDFNNIDFIAI